MTTQITLAKRRVTDYSDIEPLPDPPREPDMQQPEAIYAFYSVLRPHYAHRDDVLIAGQGYLIRNTGDRGNSTRTSCSPRGWEIRRESSGATAT